MPQPRTVMDPDAVTAAHIYAQAVLELMGDDGQAEDFHAELLSLLGILERNPGFEEVLTAASLSTGQRQALVDRVFHGRVSERMEALLGTLAKHDRMGLLRAVACEFRELLDRREGRMEVAVTTADPMDESQRRTIESSLCEALKCRVGLRVYTDEAILGGMVVRVGDRVLDSSIAADLDRLRQELRLHRRASA
ncbi:MAG: ATP synthase F1 subunit delta [Phycisphaerae bacterium]